MFIASRGILTILLMFAPSVAAAQQADVPRLRVTVVVTPERAASERLTVPAASDVLDSRDIRSLPAVSGAELVDALPSFRSLFPSASGLAPIVASRGFFGGGEAEYIQLRVDGVPIADVETGLADWHAFAPSDVERIETLRGPASALYGDTALAGVIQLFTVRRSEPGGTLSSSAGAWGSASLDVSGGTPLGQALVTGSGGYLRSDGFREHSGIQQSRARLSVDVAATGGLWRGQIFGWSRDREEPGPRNSTELGERRFGSSDLFARDKGEEDKVYGSLTYRRAADRWSFQVTAHTAWRSSDLTRTVLLLPEVGLRATRATDTSSLGAIVDASRRFGAVDWRAGAEFSRERVDTRYPETGVFVDPAVVFDAIGSRKRTGVFTSLAWDAGARVRIVPALRYDMVDDTLSVLDGSTDQHAWSPRIGASVLLGDGRNPITVFGQLSRAFKAATLDQLFDPRPFPDFRGGFFTLANRALRPQRATNGEVGAYQRSGALEWQATFYHMRVEDEIDFDIATFSYQNIGRSRHTGIELDATWRTAARVTPRAGYSWTRVRAESIDGQLKNIPEHTWFAGARAALPAAVSLDARFSGSAGAFLDDENRFSLAGAKRLDLRIARSFGRIRVRVDALNVFDDRGDAYGFALADLRGTVVPFVYPSPGRMLRGGIDVEF